MGCLTEQKSGISEQRDQLPYLIRSIDLRGQLAVLMGAPRVAPGARQNTDTGQVASAAPGSKRGEDFLFFLCTTARGGAWEEGHNNTGDDIEHFGALVNNASGHGHQNSKTPSGYTP